MIFLTIRYLYIFIRIYILNVYEIYQEQLYATICNIINFDE